MIALSAGAWSATIDPVGAGLDTLVHDGVDVVVPREDQGQHPTYRGAVLVPWPNRLQDGTYTFGGVERRFAINEPERHNALHGLVFDITWDVVSATGSEARLTCRVPHSDGYPFSLRLDLAYTLSADGLGVTLVATNTGDTPAPYGCGFHPYLSTPDGAATVVGVDAERYLAVDHERLLPVGEVAVAGTGYDLAEPRPIGDTQLDTAFTGLRRDDNGVATVRVGATRVRLDGALPWVQLYTPPGRTAIAVEPCSCPANALRTGQDLVVLEPERRYAVAWEITRD